MTENQLQETFKIAQELVVKISQAQTAMNANINDTSLSILERVETLVEIVQEVNEYIAVYNCCIAQQNLTGTLPIQHLMEVPAWALVVCNEPLQLT